MKLTSIIIVAWNMLDYTKQCVNSIKKFTDVPYELIFIDNGSHDGTWEYFKDINGARVIRNAENTGSAKAINQGIQAGSGDYYLYLSNDTVVTPNWLNNMLRCLENNLSTGMVGPRSNHIAGLQIVQNVPYKNMEEMWEFAAEFNRPDPAKWWEVNCLYGVCLAIKKEVVERVGLFDEQFEFYGDDDYSRRVRNAGYQLWCAGDTFIHHYGGRSFLGNDQDIGRLMEENREKYLQKWGS